MKWATSITIEPTFLADRSLGSHRDGQHEAQILVFSAQSLSTHLPGLLGKYDFA